MNKMKERKCEKNNWCFEKKKNTYTP